MQRRTAFETYRNTKTNSDSDLSSSSSGIFDGGRDEPEADSPNSASLHHGETPEGFDDLLLPRFCKQLGEIFCWKSSKEFFVHLHRHSSVVQKVHDELQTAYSGHLPPDLQFLPPFLPGTVCCARSVVNNEWYRAVILQETAPNRNTVVVSLYDHGLVMHVPRAFIKKLMSRFTELPKLAIKCHLNDSPGLGNKFTLDELNSFDPMQSMYMVEFVSKQADSHCVNLTHEQSKLPLRYWSCSLEWGNFVVAAHTEVAIPPCRSAAAASLPIVEQPTVSPQPLAQVVAASLEVEEPPVLPQPMVQAIDTQAIAFDASDHAEELLPKSAAMPMSVNEPESLQQPVREPIVFVTPSRSDESPVQSPTRPAENQGSLIGNLSATPNAGIAPDEVISADVSSIVDRPPEEGALISMDHRQNCSYFGEENEPAATLADNMQENHSSVDHCTGQRRRSGVEVYAPVSQPLAQPPEEEGFVRNPASSSDDNIVKAIIFDSGCWGFKAGMAGDKAPCVTFPSIVGRPRHGHGSYLAGPDDSYVGSDAQDRRWVLDLKYTMKGGIVDRWADLEKIYQHTFSRELRVDSEKYPVVLIETVNNPPRDREKMATLMFETFKVPALYIASQPVMSLFACSGRRSGLVLDSGDGITHTVPIYEGLVLSWGKFKLDFAGYGLTEHLWKTLLNKDQSALFKPSEHDLVNEVKDNLCYVSQNYDQDDKAANDSCFVKSYKLRDGRVITLSKERFQCPEALFQPSLMGVDQPGIDQLCFDSIVKHKGDVNLSKTLYENIVLAGGSTMFPGLVQRLEMGISARAPVNTNINIIASTVNRAHMAWTGASEFASADGFDGWLITRNEYSEIGDSILHHKWS